MTTDVSATAVDGSTRVARSEAEWRSLMTVFRMTDVFSDVFVRII